MKVSRARSAAAMLAVCAALCGASPGRAEEPNAILDLLEHKGLITHEEADQARQYYEKQQAAAVTKYDKIKTASWLDQLRFYGDFRTRMDYISPESSLTDPKSKVPFGLAQDDRLRWRLRLRLGAELKLQDWADVGVRLMSGEGSPGNSLSGNATFNNTFTKKPINIDLAYATIHPPHAEWISATAGKINPPVWAPSFNSPMIYDPDLTVEGAGEMLQYKFGEKQQNRVFANLGEYTAKEFTSDANDAYVFDLQAGVQLKFEPVTVTVVGGYFLTHNLNNPNFAVGDTSNIGNSTAKGIPSPATTNTVELADFHVLYGAGEVAWHIREDPILGTPAVLKVGAEYLKNMTGAYRDVPAGDATQGFTGQVTFGEAKKKGSWQVGYQYKYLEANATWDAITDDDFGGFSGGTDRKGHVIKAAYNVLDWWQLGFTTFLTDKISSQANRPSASGHNQMGKPGETEMHVMVDSMFSF